MNNKKGLSTVVTTLIIILLVFIAVGIIWVVIRNVLQGGVEEINYEAKCLEISFTTSGLVCTDTDGDSFHECNVTVTRSSRGETIDGVKIVFSTATDSYVYDGVAIGVLETGVFSADETDLANTTAVTGVEVKAYFTGDGVDHICS